MTRLQDQITMLAPNGVRYVELSDVAGYSSTRVDASALDETSFVGVDNLVADKRGRVDASYAPNTARLTAYEAGDVLIGNIRPYLKKVWRATNAGGCSGDVLAVRIRPQARNALDSHFLYYVLSSDTFFAYNMRHSKGAKMPRGNKDAILKYRIPIPPIEVQREVVRVLDQFRLLETEIEAELDARRRQYQHYEGSLLSNPEGGVNWLTLGDIGRVSMCKRVFKSETMSSGDIPFFKIGTFGEQPDAFISSALYEEYRSKYSFPKPGDVLISAAGTIGRTVVYDGAPAYFQDSNIVWIDNDESLVSNAYLRYWYRVVEWTTDGGTIRRLYNENIRRARIAVPSLNEQGRIVRALNAFESLVNSRSVGLPAELEARRKQFEYYRDKLLIFEEAAA